MTGAVHTGKHASFAKPILSIRATSPCCSGHTIFGTSLNSSQTKSFFHRTGLVELGPSDGIVIPGVHSSAATYNLPIKKMSPSEIHRRWPGIRGNDDWEAIIELNAGFLKVEECVQAHLDLATQHGCDLVHNCKVHQWSSDSREVEVVTDRGIEKAAQLVIAGGPWTRALIPELSTKLQIFRKHLYWFHPENEGFRAKDGFPVFLSRDRQRILLRLSLLQWHRREDRAA